MPTSPVPEDHIREEAEHDAGAEEERSGWYDRGRSSRHQQEHDDQEDDPRSWSPPPTHRDRHHHLGEDSAARPGSVGSNDESAMDRGGGYRSPSSSFRVFGYSAHHAAHMVNGETKFPTATSYVSDAQRSDVATVCSGSVAEDIEVESVISQDDQLGLVVATSPSHPPRGSKPFPGGGAVGATRLVEFADLPAAEPTDRHNLPYRASPQDHGHDLNAMGPPLRRALLLQQAADGGGGMSSSSRAGSVKSYGSTGSEPAENPAPGAARGSSSSQRSYAGTEDDDGPFENETDEAGSLDVEAHSIGTRSVHSQDEGVAPFGDDEGGFDNNRAAVATEETVTTGTLAQVERNVNGGRQSPGGTIYKGRGVRRYQGRYMHLPLKRFHHNGVHLEAFEDEDGEYAHGSSKRPFDPRRSDVRPPKAYEESRTGGDHRRFRSRSRSRSPDDDRKPPARRRT